ncbi:MAG: DUF4301 family protein, partial [Maribacter sp.]
MMQLTDKDKEQLAEKGINIAKVHEQINTFKEGIPFVNLKNAAVVGNGIYKFSKTEEEELVELFEKKLPELSILKFVPASGAASRMFKALFNFLESYNPKEQTLEAYLEKTNDKDMKVFADGLEKFPFYKNVKSRLEGTTNTKGEEVYAFVNELLNESALNYGFYPKGLLPFHEYPKGAATPFEEHLKEGAAYASAEGKSNLHFTISEQHETMFNFELNEVREKISEDTKTQFKVDYSFQKPSTDTIAVDMNNEPFRNPDGSLLFRPGGHGALIENLNDQDADIIFIKNIDNVAVMKDAAAVAESKKVLAGVLLQVQEKAFSYAKNLEVNINADQNIVEIKDFLKERLNVRFDARFNELSNEAKIEVLKDKLNRPVRICGMVKNEGEPGGGPFWITNAKG